MDESNLPSLHVNTKSLPTPTRGHRRHREPSPSPPLFPASSTPNQRPCTDTYASHFYLPCDSTAISPQNSPDFSLGKNPGKRRENPVPSEKKPVKNSGFSPRYSAPNGILSYSYEGFYVTTHTSPPSPGLPCPKKRSHLLPNRTPRAQLWQCSTFLFSLTCFYELSNQAFINCTCLLFGIPLPHAIF